ncbi:hypothetical protein [Macrococcus armenti]|uniref:hypothetical protein n=1 Tax=Macrococcus armenti TaxID=2875764 RepID=UPI001CC93A32|nr:hypothetical protein [Macrococcus armenti]UBH15911.1 hypothetical protein LAU44_02885 [Macrococcus armenti]UBH18272.1 hypothetical protein LAU39_02895 [Macrococcus armenti]UBH20537.1 hypothetical protein LAU40_02885 [Macrococcus armenti]
MFLFILIITMLILGLALGVYTMNEIVLSEFKKNHTQQAYIYLYATMFGAVIIVTAIAYCFQNIMIEFSNLFYRL